MKRLGLLLTLLMVMSLPVIGQTTSVTLNVTDSGSNIWANASYTVVLTPQPLGPNGPFYLQNVLMTPSQTTLTGTLNGSGSATFNVSSNPFITPTGTRWSFQVCYQPGANPCYVQLVTVSLTTQAVNLIPPAYIPPTQSGGTPCITTALSLQFNNAGAFGCVPDLTFTAPHTITVGASGIVTISGTFNVGAFTATGGITAPSFTSNGSTAGFEDFPQGNSSVAVAPCNVATSICEQAPTSVTSYLVNKPGVAAQGVETNIVTSSVDTQGFSGDVNHSATVSWSTATSVGSTSLCSTGNCPVGTYRVSAYIDVTTACTTTGSYVVNVIYTDDTTVSKTTPIPLNGTGVTFATSTLVPTSTTDYGTGVFILRTTGSSSINYSTTAGACGTGGPGVGKLYLTVEPLQ